MSTHQHESRPTARLEGPEADFLDRLAKVSPVAPELEHAHVLAAAAQARTSAGSARRHSARRVVVGRPRLALSAVAAVIANLSLPAKAFAATAVAAAAIGGAAVTLPPDTPDAATEGLTNASEQAGFPVPAHGQPEGLPRSDDGATAAENQGVDGEQRSAEAREDGRAFGQATAEEASDGAAGGDASADGQATAEEASGGAAGGDASQDASAAADARQAAAEQRREAAEQRAAEAREARQAEDDAATTTTDAVDSDDALSDDGPKGSRATGDAAADAGQARADR